MYGTPQIILPTKSSLQHIILRSSPYKAIEHSAHRRAYASTGIYIYIYINLLLLICRISADQLHCQGEPKFMVDLDMTFSLLVRNVMKIITLIIFEISPFFSHLLEIKSVFFCSSKSC